MSAIIPVFGSSLVKNITIRGQKENYEPLECGIMAHNLNLERKEQIMKRLLTIGAAALAATVAFGDVVYENDFSTRASEGAVPYAGWREQPYLTGSLVAANAGAPFTGGDIQDGWIRANNSSLCPITVFDDGGNNEVAFYKNDTTRLQAVSLRCSATSERQSHGFEMGKRH